LDDKIAGFDDSYTNEELTMFMVKQEQTHTNTLGSIKYELEKMNYFDESVLKVDRTFDYKRAILFEPSEEEIVQYFKSL